MQLKQVLIDDPQSSTQKEFDLISMIFGSDDEPNRAPLANQVEAPKEEIDLSKKEEIDLSKKEEIDLSKKEPNTKEIFLNRKCSKSKTIIIYVFIFLLFFVSFFSEKYITILLSSTKFGKHKFLPILVNALLMTFVFFILSIVIVMFYNEN